MHVVAVSPQFRDLICKDPILFGHENSAEIIEQTGGIERLLDRDMEKIDRDNVEFHSLGTKKSIILTGNKRKTTITSSIEPAHLALTGTEGVKLYHFAYAEDINWAGCQFTDMADTSALIDFSGRFETFETIEATVDMASASFARLLVCLTDHDPCSLDQCEVLAQRPQVNVLYHTPKEIQLFDHNQILKVPNHSYIDLDIDFVGYGDYLALRCSQRIANNAELSEKFFRECQQAIRRDIDACI